MRLHDALTARYPRLVDTYDRKIGAKGAEGHTDWSPWCFAAGGIAATIASNRHAAAPKTVGAGQAFEDIHRIAAIAAWRPDRYVLDLSDRPSTAIETIPAQVSPPRRLRPDTFHFGAWCPFFFLGRGADGQNRGLFVYLDDPGTDNATNGPPMLIGVVARADLACRTVTVALGQGGLMRGIETAMKEISETRQVDTEEAVEVDEEELEKEAVPRLGKTTDYAREARIAATVALFVSQADWTPPLPEAPRRTIAMAEETTVCSLA
ncbi:hypothetical protein GGP72_000236 [Salinibacter ruber]|uniref:Uncharacterized protein n=1 Tax=Salinibacter ruber TaxID=146919 RepID=A0A9X2PT66_9BACT|nr:hypothetical protein [Salinibacter ruber]MCS3676340.1 hypothetical protein [Salinibacter ruber]MCS3679627.1 hypothetical protein [Salinibacter ruber]